MARRKSYKKARTRSSTGFFSKRTKRYSSSGSRAKIIQPEIMIYGALRDKVASYIPDFNVAGLPTGASDIVLLGGAGYLLAKQKGMLRNVGHAILTSENYEAGKLVGLLVMGQTNKSQSTVSSGSTGGTQSNYIYG